MYLAIVVAIVFNESTAHQIWQKLYSSDSASVVKRLSDQQTVSGYRSCFIHGRRRTVLKTGVLAAERFTRMTIMSQYKSLLQNNVHNMFRY